LVVNLKVGAAVPATGTAAGAVCAFAAIAVITNNAKIKANFLIVTP
jgi:hypothetical protein